MDKKNKQLTIKQECAELEKRLPEPQSNLARQVLKDPYIFDFLTLAEPFQERELKTELVKIILK